MAPQRHVHTVAEPEVRKVRALARVVHAARAAVGLSSPGVGHAGTLPRAREAGQLKRFVDAP